MRVLWLDAEQNPWTDDSGFTIVEEFGLAVDRVFQAKEAKTKVQEGDFDLFLVCAEAPGAMELLAETRRGIRKQGKKIILCSWKMSRDDFKAHAKTGASRSFSECRGGAFRVQRRRIETRSL
jgi:DNA-binding response OmpR family regulator